MKNREIWNAKHARIWEELKDLFDNTPSKKVHTSEIVARCVKSAINPQGFISVNHLMPHLYRLVEEGRIEHDRRGVWRLKAVMNKELLPKELPKELIKTLKVTGDYSYRSENEREIGGILVFAPLMGTHRSGIINRASEHEFLFSNPYWLREILTRGLREGKISQKDFMSLHRFSANELYVCLGRLWNGLFESCECFAAVFWFNPQKLLKFLQREEGRKLLKSLLTKEVRTEILKEALFKMPEGYALRTRKVRR